MKRFVRLLAAVVVTALLAGCGASVPAPSPTAAPARLVFYDWVDDMPQSVLEAFTVETGIEVVYEPFDAMEDAVAQINAGHAFDVAVIEHDMLPELISSHLLAKIDFRNVPNFQNISANFRDLATDPNNLHSIPYHYGTTGMLVRTDAAITPPARWADLWKIAKTDKIAVRAQSTELLSITLLSLGYSLNSEIPPELDRAVGQLIALKPALVFVDVAAEEAVKSLVNEEAAVLVGWSEDAAAAEGENIHVRFIVPEDAPTLWFDSYVISAGSQNQAAAERFLNFLLRPEISAKIVNEKGYANANEAADALVDADIREDPTTYLPRPLLEKAAFYLPLSPAGASLYEETWQRFLDAEPKGPL